MLRLLSHRPHHHRLSLIVLQHRTLSDASNSRIISRRAWQDFTVRKHAHKQATLKTKEPEKPWPRSLQFAGYGMAILFVPYSMAWFLASNGSARDVVHSDTLNDVLRHHFGEQEQDDVNYYQVTQEHVEPHYQLDGEATFQERCQEEEIQALNGNEVKVRVRVNDAADDLVETIVAGDTLANVESILRAIGKEKGNNTSVAIDFGPVVVGEEVDQDGQLSQDALMDSSRPNDDSHSTTRETNIYSLWQYITSTKQEQQQQQQQKPQYSSSQVEMARLEHEIAQLEHDLADINCTRDRDDMQKQLQASKSALRKKKWKRRFGLVS